MLVLLEDVGELMPALTGDSGEVEGLSKEVLLDSLILKMKTIQLVNIDKFTFTFITLKFTSVFQVLDWKQTCD